MNPVLLVFLPLVAPIFVYLLTRKTELTKYIALAVFIGVLLQTLGLYTQLPESGYLELGDYLEVSRFDFVLSLAVDRLSVIMLLLTSLLLILVTLSSWSVSKHSAAYFSLLRIFHCCDLWRLYEHKLFMVFYLLGVNTDPYVLSCWNLGC